MNRSLFDNQGTRAHGQRYSLRTMGRHKICQNGKTLRWFQQSQFVPSIWTPQTAVHSGYHVKLCQTQYKLSKGQYDIILWCHIACICYITWHCSVMAPFMTFFHFLIAFPINFTQMNRRCQHPRPRENAPLAKHHGRRPDVWLCQGSPASERLLTCP